MNPQIATLNTTTLIESSRSDYTQQVFNGYFNFAQSLNDVHNFNVLVGANVDKDDYEYLYYERWNMLDTNLPELSLTDKEYSYSHQHTHTGSAGFFARINYVTCSNLTAATTVQANSQRTTNGHSSHQHLLAGASLKKLSWKAPRVGCQMVSSVHLMVQSVTKW